MVPQHGPAHRLPRHPGHRRRRPDDRRPGDHRRHRPGPGPRAVHGPHRGRLRSRLRGRTPARRVLHRPCLVALVLLLQRPLRCAHARRGDRRAEAAEARRTRTARRTGRVLPRGRLHLPRPADQLGRHGVRLGLTRHPRPGGRRRRNSRPLPRRRVLRPRTDHPAAAVPRLGLQYHQSRRRGRRRGTLRRRELSADLPPDGRRSQRHRVGSADASDDGRHRRRLHRLRPAHQPYRALQGLPGARQRGLGRRYVAAVASGDGHVTAGVQRLAGGARCRDRSGDAGADPRRAERRTARRPRHRHQRQQLLPPDRRQRRRGRLRHPLRRPAHRLARRPPPAGRGPAGPGVDHPAARARHAAGDARRLHPGVRRRHAADLPLSRAGARARPVHRLLPQGETAGVPQRLRRRDRFGAPGPQCARPLLRRPRLRDRPAPRRHHRAARRPHPHRRPGAADRPGCQRRGRAVRAERARLPAPM